MGTFTERIVFEVVYCSECGMAFGLTADFSERRVNDHKWFHCPNGHPQYYPGKSEAEQLRERLDTERKQAEFWRKKHAEVDRSRAAVRGQLTKTKKRIAGGVCPCCNRTFQNLHSHMVGQHPEYVDTAQTAGKE